MSSGMGMGNTASQPSTHGKQRDGLWVALLWIMLVLFVVVLAAALATAVIFGRNWQLERERVDKLQAGEPDKLEKLEREVQEARNEWSRVQASVRELEARQHQADVQQCRALARSLQAQATMVATYALMLEKIEKQNGHGSPDQWPATDRDRYMMYDRRRCEESQAYNEALDVFLFLRERLLKAGEVQSQVPQAMLYLPTQPRALPLFP